MLLSGSLEANGRAWGATWPTCPGHLSTSNQSCVKQPKLLWAITPDNRDFPLNALIWYGIPPL